MRKVIFACALVTGFTSAALAGEKGIASFYQNPHFSGLIAAHRTLPFGTQVKVFNLDNGRTAIVKIVDRGPFIRGRVIDVSLAAANALGFVQSGTARVRIEKI
jgi:rare lipoprotein A